ncbi:hypothetical protein B9Z55_023143 [Caenorhabditis nigoni]|uniref:Uncharacterized protein n=1 Tax=Caenorhabditis nigoni TaxID=1611254 RepID=A0A2G5SNK9_9PELO|nr:hypothetical protein B9Z55_023143 [Caenorhabditis nigoni]
MRRLKEHLNVREVLFVASMFAIGNYLLPTPNIEEHPTEHRCSVKQYRTAANITRPSWRALLMTPKPEISKDQEDNDHQQYHNSVHFHLKAKKFCSSPPSRDLRGTTWPSKTDEDKTKTTRTTYPTSLGSRTHPPRKAAPECPGCTTLDSEKAGRTTNYSLLDSQKTTADYPDVAEHKTHPPRKIAQECPGCTTLDSEEAGRTTASYPDVANFKTHPPRKNEADSTHPPRKDEPRGAGHHIHSKPVAYCSRPPTENRTPGRFGDGLSTHPPRGGREQYATGGRTPGRFGNDVSTHPPQGKAIQA